MFSSDSPFSLRTSLTFKVMFPNPTFLSSFFKKKKKFIYLWLHWVFVAAHGLSLIVASGGDSLVVMLPGLLIAVALTSLVVELRGSRQQAQQLWCTGLVALSRVASSQTRELNPCSLHWQVDF